MPTFHHFSSFSLACLLLACWLPGSVSAQLDADNNGLSDVWEDKYAPVPLPIGIDIDDDTLDTLQECIAGSDPRNANSLHDVSEYFIINSRSEVNYLRLRWLSRPGKEYKLRVAHPGPMVFTELDNTLMLGNGQYQYIYQYHSGTARGAGGVFAEIWSQLPAGVTSLGSLSATTVPADATLGLSTLEYDNNFLHPYRAMRVRGYVRSSDETGDYTISLDTAGSGAALFKIGTAYGAADTVTNLFQAGLSSSVGNSAPIKLRRYQPYPFEIDYLPNPSSGVDPAWSISLEIPGNTNAPPTVPVRNNLVYWLDVDRELNPLLAENDCSVFDVLVRDRDSDNDGVTDWEELELELAPWNPTSIGGVPDSITAANLLGGVDQTLQLVANPQSTIIEGTGGSVTYTLARLSGTGPLTVPYTIGGQSEASDLNVSAPAFVFSQNAEQAIVTFNALNDNRLEPAEFAVITVQPPPTVTLVGSPHGGFSIEDELDPQPILFVAEYGPEGDADTGATGFSTLLLSADRGSALVSSSFENLTSPQTAAHIHRGAVGVSGPVVQGLPTDTFDNLAWQFAAPPANMNMPGMVMAATDHQGVLDDLTNGRLYANVHSAVYGSGEIRGNYGLADGSDLFIPPDPLPQDPGAPNAPDAEVFRFLEQASFGPIASERAAVKSMGMSAWINQQMNTPLSAVVDYHLAANEWDRVYAYDQDWDELFTPYRRNTNAGIWNSALDGRDQLRQRMAFALSEIFVISAEDSSVNRSYLGKSHYWDMLAGHAFGNFRDLLEDVSRHPVMGLYLSHIKNRKANDAAGTKPDENYAREVMQLFTIGLLELHPDGSLKLDATTGQPVATYTNDDITELARFFTGFAIAYEDDGSENTNFFYTPNNSNKVVSTEIFEPMKMFDNYHDFDEKTILKDVVVPADLDMEVEIDLVMDALFYHENTPPFIARRLIQRLTTSNPSRGYIYRVAQAFEDNGQGVRGDMAAVTRAILLDQEARNPVYYDVPSFGKTKEPLLRYTAALRALSYTNGLPLAELAPYGLNPNRYQSGAFRLLYENTDSGSFDIGQSFLRAPTVFNWFLPDYAPAGIISDNNLHAPETQILTDNFLVENVNSMTFFLYFGGRKNTGNLLIPNGLTSEERTAAFSLDDIVFEVDEFAGLTVPQLVDMIDDRFFGGRMSSPLRTSMLTNVPNITPTLQHRSALALAFISPEFASQR